MKDLRRDILRRVAVPEASRDIRVNTLEVVFVEIAEAARILLCRLDEQAFAGFPAYRLQWDLRSIDCQ